MNILDFLVQNNIPFKRAGDHHHVRGDFIGVDCPFCSRGSGRYRMGISPTRGYSTCWTCGYRNLVETLQALSGLAHGECRRLAGGMKSHTSAREPRHTGRYKPPQGVLPMKSVHRKYLEEDRGFESAEIERLWSVEGIGLSSRLSWRLFIPIIHNGTRVSWTTRSIAKKSKLRYISASPEEESLSLKHMLYGEDYCRHAIVIVEGPLDAWAIGPGAVATLGLSYTQTQILSMVKYPVRAICFDSSHDAQKRANVLAMKLSCFSGETSNIVLETGEDPADAETAEIDEIRQKFLL